jgi:hypothetical protein
MSWGFGGVFVMVLGRRLNVVVIPRSRTFGGGNSGIVATSVALPMIVFAPSGCDHTVCI